MTLLLLLAAFAAGSFLAYKYGAKALVKFKQVKETAKADFDKLKGKK